MLGVAFPIRACGKPEPGGIILSTPVRSAATQAFDRCVAALLSPSRRARVPNAGVSHSVGSVVSAAEVRWCSKLKIMGGTSFCCNTLDAELLRSGLDIDSEMRRPRRAAQNRNRASSDTASPSEAPVWSAAPHGSRSGIVFLSFAAPVCALLAPLSATRPPGASDAGCAVCVVGLILTQTVSLSAHRLACPSFEGAREAEFSSLTTLENGLLLSGQRSAFPAVEIGDTDLFIDGPLLLARDPTAHPTGDPCRLIGEVLLHSAPGTPYLSSSEIHAVF